MLFCCVIITFAGVPSIDIKHLSNDNGHNQYSVEIDWGQNANAHQRELHACGDDVVTGDITAHAVKHCNIWQLGILILGLLAIVATVIAGTIGTGGAFLSFTGAQWLLIAGAYGGLALLYSYLASVCNPNKGVC